MTTHAPDWSYYKRVHKRAVEMGDVAPIGTPWGTSNHFRRDKLLQLGAWDSFNVTEDADLGMRLTRLGFRC